MNYLEFRKQFIDLVCFNTRQVYAWQAGFDKNNLTRWQKKDLLIKLRQGFYTFPEYIGKQNFAFYFANKMYQPSYISLHTALSYYGIIPEAVIQIMSVCTLKTATFNNAFGTYVYKTIKNDLFFGYNLISMDAMRTYNIAKPEKAILDLLYLYNFYNTEQEIVELRLDEGFLAHNLNIPLFQEYASLFKNKSLESRVKKLIKIYEL
ncbi:MAG: hypothetical protein BWY70_00318 [Bacteroidetes bacterium ADurb.Bin408]|nr:MAG: hypothetical protein BWY70_00318 [Bacteroidetes bacterium ADurb.Bin408]